EGRTHLTEAEALDLLDLLGVPTPRRFLAAADGSFDPGQLASLEASKVYVKAVSPGLLHKSEAGAVASCAASQDALQGTLAAMARRTQNLPVTGFLVEEAVAVPPVLGAELLFSLRFTPDFGPVATLALGGVEAELLARETAASRRLAVASPILGPEGAVRSLAASFAGVAATTARRGRPAVAELPAVAAFLTEVLGRQEGSMPDPIAEIEINPLAWTESGPVALDALVRLGAATREPAPPRPLAALQAMVRPRTVAVLGASAHHLNPGRVVVRNLLEAGFPPENLWIVKRDLPALEGCPCFPDLGSLPGPVDLLVLAVGAERLPQLVEEAAAGGKVRGLLLIPGGVSDRGEGAARIRRALSQARAAGRDVVANGPNCLGLRSVPGHCNTLFVPIEKLRFARGGPQPLALISQSGAFAIARSSRLPWMNLRYIVTLGNQLDATCADWLEALAEDPEVAVLGCYVEG
ncbi:MAG: acetate--CoA ligase family protein, partial [Acidobacteria bacterium]|nr:acetate--CoA ligase family protein [Acidobacteriota bacterium]